MGEPGPALPSVNTREKVAVTDLAASTVTMQVVAAPLHAPPQVEKTTPPAAAAVSRTGVPLM